MRLFWSVGEGDWAEIFSCSKSVRYAIIILFLRWNAKTWLVCVSRTLFDRPRCRPNLQVRFVRFLRSSSSPFFCFLLLPSIPCSLFVWTVRPCRHCNTVFSHIWRSCFLFRHCLFCMLPIAISTKFHKVIPTCWSVSLLHHCSKFQQNHDHVAADAAFVFPQFHWHFSALKPVFSSTVVFKFPLSHCFFMFQLVFNLLDMYKLFLLKLWLVHWSWPLSIQEPILSEQHQVSHIVLPISWMHTIHWLLQLYNCTCCWRYILFLVLVRCATYWDFPTKRSNIWSVLYFYSPVPTGFVDPAMDFLRTAHFPRLFPALAMLPQLWQIGLLLWLLSVVSFSSSWLLSFSLAVVPAALAVFGALATKSLEQLTFKLSLLNSLLMDISSSHSSNTTLSLPLLDTLLPSIVVQQSLPTTKTTLSSKETHRPLHSESQSSQPDSRRTRLQIPLYISIHLYNQR